MNLLLVAVVLSGMWRYAIRRGLLRPDAVDEEVQALTARLTPGLAGYLALIGVALVFPWVAVVGYLVVALLLIFPFGHRSVGKA